MSTVRATWSLYRDSLLEASKGLGRSMWAVVALILAYAAVTVVALVSAPLGIVGGFIIGLFQAAVIGWYLSLVEIGVAGRRRVRMSDLRDNAGTYFIEVISVLFIFWIGSMLLGALGEQVMLLAVLLVTVLFNPIPEMIYQERSQSLQLLGESLSFMQQNWLEWLGGMVPFVWLAAESQHAYSRTRLKVRVGLAEPIVSNRFLLIGLYGTLASCTYQIYLWMYIIYERHGVWSDPLNAVSGTVEVISLVALWISFAAPPFYQRWVNKTQPSA